VNIIQILHDKVCDIAFVDPRNKLSHKKVVADFTPNYFYDTNELQLIMCLLYIFYGQLVKAHMSDTGALQQGYLQSRNLSRCFSTYVLADWDLAPMAMALQS